MNFRPRYAHCSRCDTDYALGMAKSLCPQCGIPLSVVGIIERGEYDIVLDIPGELREAFVTFLEVGLASVTAHLEELEEDKLQLVELLRSTVDRLEHTEPTPGETLNRNRALLRGDSVDMEGP